MVLVPRACPWVSTLALDRPAYAMTIGLKKAHMRGLSLIFQAKKVRKRWGRAMAKDFIYPYYLYQEGGFYEKNRTEEF
jgi:hypothetical protein